MSQALVDFLRSTGDEEDEIALSEEDDPSLRGESMRHNIFNDEYELVEIDAPPPPEGENWVFPILYKLGGHGDMLSYQIGYNATSKKLLWLVGRVETGGLTLFSLDIVPTRAQKGSYSKKAYSEALNRMQMKTKNGFHREMTGASELAIPLPMLANKYKAPNEDGTGSNVPHMPVAAQAKFDGERHLVYADRKTGQTKQLSRLMNVRKHFEHIREEGGRLLEFLPPGSILDGELYSNLIPFQLITSIAGSKNEKHPREKDLDFYVFDVYHPETVWRPGIAKEIIAAHTGEGDRVEDMVYAKASGYTIENYSVEAREYFELPQDDGTQSADCVHYSELLVGSPMWVVEVRIMLLMNAFRCFKIKYGHWPRHVKLVKTYIVHTREDISQLFFEISKLDIGGPEKLEGIMLRQMSRGDANPVMSLYHPGRSNALLKVKGLVTTEVIITGVKPGKGKAKDLATLLYKEPGTSLTGTVVPKATHEERRAMLLNPHTVKGRTMTVSYQNRMSSGKMRFPVGVAFVN